MNELKVKNLNREISLRSQAAEKNARLEEICRAVRILDAETEKKKRLENGYGLRKMREYVQTHAGSFKIEAENGFQVQVELPLVSEALERGE